MIIRKQTKIKINQREINHKSEEKNMADYETQVVVIAGGPSGLSAAVQAAEDGAEVIVLEKAAAVGGAANNGTTWYRNKISETADGRCNSRKSI